MPTNVQESGTSVLTLSVPPMNADENEERPSLRQGVELTNVEGLGWVLHNRKDGKYSRVSSMGELLIGRLDGRHTVAQLSSHLQEATGRPVSAGLVRRFIESLAEQGMLADREGRREDKKRKIQKLLHLRFPFFRGEKIVGAATALVQRTPRIVGYPLLLTLVIWGMIGPLLLISQGEIQWHLRLRTLSWHTLAVLIPLILIELVLHELAHGVALTICGGSVREFGIGSHYIIVPYSYTNTTDSYRLGKKERIFVSVAGPLVEFAMLGINSLALLYLPADSAMRPVVALLMAFELSAIIWNANPLLPFDGYLILSDLLREPNLRKRGFELLKNRVRRVLGRPAPESHYGRRQKAIYLAYGSLAILYLVFLFGYGFILAAIADPRLHLLLIQKHPALVRLIG